MTYKKTRIRTGRQVMLEVMRRHPEGLTAMQISEMTRAEYATTSGNIAAILCHMVKEGRVFRMPRTRCDCCWASIARYKAASPQEG